MKDSLKLVLKHKWYDMIESGEKKEEYRDIKPFWWQRIFTSPFQDNLLQGWYDGRFKYVTFYRGYASDRKSMTFRLGRVGIQNARPEWAEGHMNRMITLELLEKL